MTERGESPCIRQCTLDLDKICVGCGRTLDDILDWSRANPEERQRILADAAVRRMTREERIRIARRR